LCKLVQCDEIWVHWAHEFPSLAIQEINVILPKHIQDYPNFFFYRCTVHSDICSVHSPTNALLLV